jgi:hypothetical protein
MTTLTEKSEAAPETEVAASDEPQEPAEPGGFVGDLDWAMHVAPYSLFY